MIETTVLLHRKTANANPDYAIILTFHLQVEHGQRIGQCKELGTTAYGTDYPEIRERLRKAVTDHLNQLDEDGIIEDYLSQHGVALHLVPDDKAGFSFTT